MKFRTKSIEVEELHSISENIGLLSIEHRSFQIDKRLFDLLFEPVEEELEKHETFQCEECSNDFPLSVLYTDPDGLSLCKTCYDDCN